MLDSNVFVQAKNLHYRFQFCAGFWDWIEAAHTACLVSSVAKVRAELLVGRPNVPARMWATSLPDGFFLEDVKDRELVQHSGDLMAWVTGSTQFSAAAIREFAADKNADAFIVAEARRPGQIVVTHKTDVPEAKRRVPLPNAAKALGVQTISIYDLLSLHAESTFKFKP